MSYDPSNDCGTHISVYNPEKFGLYAVKMKAFAAMKGFGKALDLKFKSKLPAKEDDVLD